MQNAADRCLCGILLRLQIKLSAELKAQGKPMPAVPDVPQLWGEMPHPLQWSLSAATGKEGVKVGDLLDISKKVRSGK